MLLLERKKHEVLAAVNHNKNVQVQKLIDEDSDLAKPELEVLAYRPKNYNKKVLIKKINEEGNEVYNDEMNEFIFKEIGNFGDIVQISRFELTKGFVCPPTKRHLTMKPELDQMS